nr:MAG TPA: protein of unknown function (DUF4187) [Caudoviricetes sp.]
MKETYCEWCGSVLLEDGHCPIVDCVQNVILDALDDVKDESKKESEEKKDDTNPTA